MTSLKSYNELKVMVIGDPHFKIKNIIQSIEYTQKCYNICVENNPRLIVILGDNLDTHEKANVDPFNQCYDFIEKLSEICPVAVLIGNHDVSNQNDFLSKKHFFRPLNKFKNIILVDEVKVLNIEGRKLLFCPYTPKGRFKEALELFNKNNDDYCWEYSDCIFAHQEFKDCHLGAAVSEDGDEWDESNPLVVSGHIHDQQTVGKNIIYTGSSRQHSFSECPNKYLYLFKFITNEDGDDSYEIEKFKVDLKIKKTLHYKMTDIDVLSKINYDPLIDYKIKLECTKEEKKQFIKSKIYSTLSEFCVIDFNVKEIIVSTKTKNDNKILSYNETLKQLILAQNNSELVLLYKEIIQ